MMDLQELRTYLSEHLGPQGVKDAFYYGQVFIVGIFAAIVWYRRPKPTQSGFAVREADLRTRGQGRLKPGAKDPLAHARIQRQGPLSLPGIRIDGPPHEVLGISPAATEIEIQRAYRERMKQYHPDKVGAPGTREWTDAQKIAEAINRAKEELLKRRRSGS